jgi:hypothetical protein
MLHIIYPESRNVTEEQVIVWAHDDLVNAAYASLPQDAKSQEDAMERLSASIARPSLEDAMVILEDNGSVTFGR